MAEPGHLQVTVRYFAAARAAAGVSEETLSPPAAPAGTDKPEMVSTVGSVVAMIAARHGSGLVRVLARCSYLLDEVAVHGPSTPVRDGQVLDVLPPFAGG